MNDMEHDEQLWLLALAGQAPDNTAKSTRTARQLRDYLNRRSALELGQIADDATHVRTMNYLRAKGAFLPPSGQPGAAKSAWKFINNWLFSAGGSSRKGYALMTGIALAVLVAPLVWMQTAPSSDGSVKSGSRLPATTETVLLSDNPSQLALDIQNALMATGVVATLIPNGSQVILLGKLGHADRAAVQHALQAFGVAIPGDGQLRLSVRRPD